MADNPALTSTITAALATAEYDKLDDGSFSGRIPNYPGVLAFAPTLAACRDELQSTLQDWLLLGLNFGHPLPILENIDINGKPILKPSHAP